MTTCTKTCLRSGVAACAIFVSAGAAWAECGIESGSVRILSNDFAALHAIAEAAETCASDTVEVTRNQTEDHKNIQVAALTTDPATYTVAVVATNSIVPLMNDDLIRPLNDLVEQYGQQLTEGQLIRVNGDIVAIAFMANAQHLFYREDILAENGLEVPTSYEEMFEVAQALQDAGVMQTPIVSSFMPGWNVAAEFVNAYLGTGNEFFVPGTAELAIDNADGLLVLETLKRMTDYMSADYTTYDSNAQMPVWEAGETALAINWGSRSGAFIDAEAADQDIAAATRFAAAPTLGDTDIPSAALWWDGFTIAKNISDEDAEASFRAMMVGISPEMMAENMDAAVWLIDGYEATPASMGVIGNLESGAARPYPMLPYMGLLHTALGDNLSDYLAGDESAEQALADIEAAYNTAATEAGFLN